MNLSESGEEYIGELGKYIREGKGREKHDYNLKIDKTKQKRC